VFSILLVHAHSLCRGHHALYLLRFAPLHHQDRHKLHDDTTSANTAADSDGSAADDDEDDEQPLQDRDQEDPDVLHYVFHRMSRIIRPRRLEQRAAGLRWMGAVASQLEPQDLLPYLPPVAAGLYSILTRQEENEPHKGLAQEVFEVVQERSGADGAFLRMYNDVKQARDVKRAKRKRLRAVEAVMDPAAAAAKKMRRNKAKRCVHVRGCASVLCVRVLGAP